MDKYDLKKIGAMTKEELLLAWLKLKEQDNDTRALMEEVRTKFNFILDKEGERLEDGGLKMVVANHLIKMEVRRTKVYDMDRLSELLKDKGFLPSVSVPDMTKVKGLVKAKVLKEEEVEACRLTDKTTSALVVKSL